MAIDNGGALYFYPGSSGSFGARQVISGDWSILTALMGGVDYNGDGIADLIGRTTAGDLYLYAGTGTGSVSWPLWCGLGWAGFLQIE
jgi:hypothetical protein